jgi:2-dehydropantoate 2-reductase
MHVLFLGAGATGGYFGGRLVEAKAADVTFLVRETRKQQLDRDGLRLESPLGGFTLKVGAVTSADDAAPADIVVLTCKAYDLTSAIAAIRPAVGPHTAVLPLLNGIAHLDVLNAAFGRANVLGGSASIHITMLPDGLIRHAGDWCFITFGEQDGRMSERVMALKSAFDRSPQVKAAAVPDVLQKMWDKIVLLATLAGMTTLMRANLGTIVRAGGADISRTMLERNALIAARSGFAVPEAVMAGYRKLFSDPSSGFTASMLRDLEKSAPVEADHIIGFMRERARALGVDDCLHTIAYVHLKAYEERRKAGEA